MVNFDSLPSDKPNQNTVAEGRYTATVFDAKMMVSKNTNSEYLNVSFKISTGGFVNENYFESDKPFLLYKLGRLLKACDVKLAGEGSLKDIAKVIKNKTVVIDVAVNDKGYGSLDYSGDKEGIYSLGEMPVEEQTPAEDTATVTADPAVASELAVDPYEDF